MLDHAEQLSQNSLPWYMQQPTDQLSVEFQKTGFLLLPAPVEKELLDEVRAAAKAMPSGRQPDAWQTIEPVRKLATHPNILAILQQLYRRTPIPFQTLNFDRSPQQPIHTDALHFNSYPTGYMCGVWIALEPIDIYNGTLCYYPGSHLEPFYTLADLGIQASLEPSAYMQNQLTYARWLVQSLQRRGLREHWLQCEADHMIIWAANLAHGSINILDVARTRYSQVTHYFFEDCMYYIPAYSNIPVGVTHYKSVTNIITGEKVPHRYFGRQELTGELVGPQLTLTQGKLFYE